MRRIPLILGLVLITGFDHSRRLRLLRHERGPCLFLRETDSTVVCDASRRRGRAGCIWHQPFISHLAAQLEASRSDHFQFVRHGLLAPTAHACR